MPLNIVFYAVIGIALLGLYLLHIKSNKVAYTFGTLFGFLSFKFLLEYSNLCLCYCVNRKLSNGRKC